VSTPATSYPFILHSYAKLHSLALILGVHRPVLGKEIGPEEVGLGFAATDETGTLAVDKDFRGTATAIVV
jgi:hypothetical protein